MSQPLFVFVLSAGNNEIIKYVTCFFHNLKSILNGDLSTQWLINFDKLSNFGQTKIVCYCYFTDFRQVTIVIYTNFEQVVHLLKWVNNPSFLEFL